MYGKIFPSIAQRDRGPAGENGPGEVFVDARLTGKVNQSSA